MTEFQSLEERAEIVRYIGTDHFFWANVKLFVRTVLQLEFYKGVPEVYDLHGHPIQKVEVGGYVVSKIQKQDKVIYEVDDGTGVIPCVLWLKQGRETKFAILGDYVFVQGRVGEFWDRRQLTINGLEINNDKNAEAKHWLEVLWLNKEVYR